MVRTTSTCTFAVAVFEPVSGADNVAVNAFGAVFTYPVPLVVTTMSFAEIIAFVAKKDNDNIHKTFIVRRDEKDVDGAIRKVLTLYIPIMGNYFVEVCGLLISCKYIHTGFSNSRMQGENRPRV